MIENPSILIIGDGAVGSIIGGILIEKGFDITMLAKTKERANLLSSEGVQISGVCGNIKTLIPSIENITKIKKRPDFVFITTKAPDMPKVVKELQPILPDDCLVVSMQNGIVEEEVSRIIGEDRTVGCIVGWGATMRSQGVLEMASRGEFVIGYLHKEKDQKMTNLAYILNHIMPTEISENILDNLYSKLIINACITTVGAICGLPLGKMLSQSSYRGLFINIIEEAISVANAMELKVAIYAGKLDYYKFLNWSRFRKNIFLLAFGYKYRRLKSSSLQSLERKRQTEVNYFNGYISSKGSQFGIQTPINDVLTKLVHEIEAGKREISRINLDNTFDNRGNLKGGKE
jgi:2-dehydropantoate 2-reductase